VGIADRDYMRAPAPERTTGGWVLAASVLALLLWIMAVPSNRHWFQRHLGSNRPLVATFKPLAVGPGIQVGRPYAPNDSWAAFLPRASDCPGSTKEPSDSTAESSMICVLNYARTRDGLTALPVSAELQRAARLKALDIVRCQEFSHAACGEKPHAVVEEAGYPAVPWGENIYSGSGPFMPARVAADGWLNSPHHRENLFRPQWTEQGIAVVIARRFKGRSNVAIWVSQFGERR
jgi:uncharacterized protein YkwD